MGVGDGDYSITVGPYGYFWFQVDDQEKKEQPGSGGELQLFKTDASWEKVFNHYDEIRTFERKILQPFMKKCRWFGGKAKVISKMSVHKVVPLKVEGQHIS